MNGSRSKQLRKLAYGDTSVRVRRHYLTDGRGVINDPASPRGIYLGLKRAWMRARGCA